MRALVLPGAGITFSCEPPDMGIELESSGMEVRAFN